MLEFTIGDRVTYIPSFGLPKPVIVISTTDGYGYVDIQFVNLADFADFRDIGISEVISEMDRIGRVPESALSFLAHYEDSIAPSAPLNTLDVPPNSLLIGICERRRRPSSRSRRRRT